MVRVLFQPRPLWVNVNVVLFLGYALFGIASLFLPSRMRLSWFVPLHIATLIVNVYVAWGLVNMQRPIYYLVAVISFLMAAHLVAFLFAPLGMAIAYLGPSRAFYAGLLALATKLAGEKGAAAVIVVFNAAMLVVQIVNVHYFIKKRGLERTL
jgi:hypothetical protein